MKPDKTRTPRKKVPRKSGLGAKAVRLKAAPSSLLVSATKPAEPRGEVPPEPEVQTAGGMKPARRPEKPRSTGATSSPAVAALEEPSIPRKADPPATPAASGPGPRDVLGPTASPARVEAAEGPSALPEAYGTRKLLLTARDPHWLYAHWDLTCEQAHEFNRRAADGHLALRVYIDAVAGEPFSEVPVRPESRTWFVHVGSGGTRFVGELGYYAKEDRRWESISTSAPTLTPPDRLSSDTTVQFATIPIDIPFQQLIDLVKLAAWEHIPLAEAILRFRAEGFTQLPSVADISAVRWTAEQEQTLARIISLDQGLRIRIGSLEITELLRRQILGSSEHAAQFSLPTSPIVASVTSPYGAAEQQKGFWFTVNAELIVYGATEPDAQVTIGGRPIQLRPDGTFSYRFALPDGQYELVVVALSSDKTDDRAAELKFSRSTGYRGDVCVLPQEPRIEPPQVGKVAQ